MFGWYYGLYYVCEMKSTKAVAIINEVAIRNHDADIVQMIADGMTAKEIAPHYGVKDRAIEARILNLRNRIGCKNTYGLVAIFFRNGLIK